MIKLILHNIRKHTFLFSLIGVMILVLSVYLVIGMNTVFSVTSSLKRAVAENITGDMIISSVDAQRIDVMTKDGEKAIVPLKNPDALLEFLRSHPDCENASPRLRVWTLVRSDLNEAPMILTGVDPGSEPGLLPHRKLVEGRWLGAANEIVMYYRHMDMLSTAVGSDVGINIQTMDGYLNFDNAKIVGSVDYQDCSYYMEFSYFGFVDLDYLNQLLMTNGKTVGEIFVKMKDPGRLAALRAEIDAKFPGLYRYTMPDESANLIGGIYKLTFFAVYFVAFILMGMVYLCSSFLINLSIETRRQEIGIYQALGVKKWRIGLLFGGEFFFVMLFSGIIGVLAGLFLMSGVSTEGIEASIIPLKLVFGREKLFILNDPTTFAIIGVILFLAFFVSTLNAIVKLARLDPVEVMREL